VNSESIVRSTNSPFPQHCSPTVSTYAQCYLSKLLLDCHTAIQFCSAIWLEPPDFSTWSQCYQPLSSHVLVRGNEPGYEAIVGLALIYLNWKTIPQPPKPSKLYT